MKAEQFGIVFMFVEALAAQLLLLSCVDIPEAVRLCSACCVDGPKRRLRALWLTAKNVLAVRNYVESC